MATFNRSSLLNALTQINQTNGARNARTIIGDQFDAHDTAITTNTTGIATNASALSALTTRVTALETPHYVNVQPSNPTTTTSTTGVMAGIGGTFKLTPLKSGLVVAMLTGDVYNAVATAGRGATVTARFGTGTAPSNGAALTGTAFTTTISSTRDGTTGNTTPFALIGIFTGTPATAYWIDLAQAAVTSGTAVITNLTCIAFEIGT